jgi:hypothetical protein
VGARGPTEAYIYTMPPLYPLHVKCFVVPTRSLELEAIRLREPNIHMLTNTRPVGCVMEPYPQRGSVRRQLPIAVRGANFLIAAPLKGDSLSLNKNNTAGTRYIVVQTQRKPTATPLTNRIPCWHTFANATEDEEAVATASLCSYTASSSQRARLDGCDMLPKLVWTPRS